MFQFISNPNIIVIMLFCLASLVVGVITANLVYRHRAKQFARVFVEELKREREAGSKKKR